MAMYMGTAGDDSLVGGAGNDELQGLEGNDTLRGGLGDDTLYAGFGSDSIDGGAGTDTVMLGGYRSDYDISWSATSKTYTLVHRYSGFTTTTKGVELFQFSAESWGSPYNWGNLIPDATTGDGYRLTGTAGADLLQGSAGFDYLNGGDGDDVLNGFDQNDTLYGGLGNDTLYAGFGNDVVDGGTGTDTVMLGGYRSDYDISWSASSKTYTLVHRYSGFTTTTKGVELFQFSAESWGSPYNWGNLIPDATTGDGYRLTGTAGADLLQGSAGFDYLNGGDGDDVLNGFDQNDTLYGGLGNDTLYAGFGNDVVDGGTGTDTVMLGGYRSDYDISWSATSKTYTLVHRYSGFTTTTKGVELFQFSAESWGSPYNWGNLIPDATTGDGYRLTGTAGADLLQGSAGFDYLNGGDGDDVLNGFDQNDTLYGGLGNDTLYAGFGNDVVDGGTGTDTVMLGGYRSDYDISWSATAKTYTLVHRYSGFTTTTKGVELFQFSAESWGSPYNWGNLIPDATTGDGYRLTGTAGADLLQGSAGFDYLNGGDGDDVLNGFDQNDTLYGGLGNDTLYAGFGNDVVDGGTGTDTVMLGGYRSDYDISWSATARTYTLVHRYSGFSTTTKGVELFQFSAESWGSPYNWGNLIPDATTGDGYRLTGTAGADLLQGSAGFDYLNGGDGDDVLNGFDQNDTLYGGLGNDTLYAGFGNDVLDGGAGTDTVMLGGYRSDYDISWSATAKTYTLVHHYSGFTTQSGGLRRRRARWPHGTAARAPWAGAADARSPVAGCVWIGPGWAWMFCASWPLGPCWMSKLTRDPCFRVLKPSIVIAEKWAKTSEPPPSGSMNPKPLASLNHLTVPVAICAPPFIVPSHCARVSCNAAQLSIFSLSRRKCASANDSCLPGRRARRKKRLPGTLVA
jgi:Ca2+-binding RTX toxin-like protein